MAGRCHRTQRRRGKCAPRAGGSRWQASAARLVAMTGKASADTDLMSVSIVAGPAARSVIDRFDGATVFDEPAGSTPEQIIHCLQATAEKGEADHLILPCAADRPAMAYASLFADPSSGLSKLAQLTRVAFAIDAKTLLDALLDREQSNISPIFLA